MNLKLKDPTNQNPSFQSEKKKLLIKKISNCSSKKVAV